MDGFLSGYSVDSLADIRQRLLASVDDPELMMDDLHGLHLRSDVHRKKEAAFESLDYDVIESNLHVLTQRSNNKKTAQAIRVRIARWVLTIVSGAVTALVACFIDVNVKALNKLKFDATYAQIKKGVDDPVTNERDLILHLWWPLLTFVGISVGFVMIPAFLVSFVEPVARGSGIPEVKCYLNGVKIPRVVRFLTLITKAIGVLFSVAGGLPVGKEGPMIHSGSVVAAGLSQGKSSSLGIDTSWTKFHPFRNDHEKRDFVACGAAAGVAAAFGAPVGGALFALEEGTTHWNDFLTWRTFVCAMVSGFTLQIVLSSEEEFGKLSQKGMITFGSFEQQDHRYSVQEIPLFILLGVVGGVLGCDACSLTPTTPPSSLRGVPTVADLVHPSSSCPQWLLLCCCDCSCCCCCTAHEAAVGVLLAPAYCTVLYCTVLVCRWGSEWGGFHAVLSDAMTDSWPHLTT